MATSGHVDPLVSTGRGLICELCQDHADGSWRLVRELD